MIDTLTLLAQEEAVAPSVATGNISLSLALILGAALVVGYKVKPNWTVAPMILTAMFTVALSSSSALRPTLDALNGALASLVNSVGGSGIV